MIEVSFEIDDPSVEPYDAKPRWAPASLDDVEYIVGKAVAADRAAATIRERAVKMAQDFEEEAAWWRQRYAPEVVDIIQAEIAHRHGKKRSVDLLTGIAGFRLVPENIVVDKDQEDAALAWASEHLPEAVTIIPASATLNRTLLKRQFESNGSGGAVYAKTGEAVEFARVEEARDVFYMKAAPEKKETASRGEEMCP